MKSKQLSIFLFYFLLGLGSPLRICDAQLETKTFVAYSMKVAQERVEAAGKAGENFRKKQPDLYYLSGITKPWAVVIDANNSDWILVGERDPKSSVLTLDDWVTALRARFIHPKEDPGVTIDPRPCEECIMAGKKEGCSHYTKQDVRFFAGIENTHLGQVCYEADWLMKKIGLGLEKLPVEKLRTYYDLLVEQHRNSGASKSNVGSRFWFFPIVNRVNVLEQVVLLEKFQMGVFTEVRYAEIDGKPVADLDKLEHYPSERFSRLFTENYDEAAQAREVLETLRGLTRLAALAKGLTQVDSQPELGFFITGYPLDKSRTPKEAEVLKVQNHDVGFKIFGGVNLMALAIRLKDGDASALRNLLCKMRPGPDALNWGFDIEIQDGQLVGVSLPPDLADPNQRAWLFSQGVFLKKKKRYNAAIEYFNKLLRIAPDDLVAYCYRGAVLLENRMPEQALEDFNKALQIDETNVYALCLKGDTLYMLNRYEQAIFVFDEALEKNPHNAVLWADKGVALKDMGRYEQAIGCYEQAIQLDATKSIFWRNKGVVFTKMRKYAEALSCFDQALNVQPSDGWAWYFKGEMFQRIGRLREAVDCFERASPFVPEEILKQCTRYIQLLRGH